MTNARKIELLESLLATMIADIGYPVGCGIAPHPETISQIAVNCLKIATSAKDL